MIADANQRTQFALAYGFSQLLFTFSRAVSAENVIAAQAGPTLRTFFLPAVLAFATVALAPTFYGLPLLLVAPMGVLMIQLERSRSILLRDAPYLASCGEIVFLVVFLLFLLLRVDPKYALLAALASQVAILIRPVRDRRDLPLRSQGILAIEFALGRGVIEGLLIVVASVRPSDFAGIKLAQTAAGMVLVGVASVRVWALGRFGEQLPDRSGLVRWLAWGCAASVLGLFGALVAIWAVPAVDSELALDPFWEIPHISLILFLAGATLRLPEGISRAFLVAAGEPSKLARARTFGSVTTLIVFWSLWRHLGGEAVAAGYFAMSVSMLFATCAAAIREAKT